MSGSYLTFAARRFLAAGMIAVLVSAVTFLMLHVLRPEVFFDPRPLPSQLVDYLWGAFTRFDLGRSYQPPFRPVGDLIRERMWADFSLFLGAALFGVAAGMAGGGVWGRGAPGGRVLRGEAAVDPPPPARNARAGGAVRAGVLGGAGRDPAVRQGDRRHRR